MRKLLGLALAAAVAGMAATAANAQTADEIIAKNLEARGGKEKIAAVRTARATGRMLMGPEMEAPFTITWKKPGMIRLEFTIQGATAVHAFDGTTGWNVMPFMGKTDPEKMSEEDLADIKEQADWDGPLVDYKSKGHQVEFAGKETVEGTEVYKIRITKQSGAISHSLIDAETFLEIKEQGTRKIRGQDLEFETSLGDYKEVAGLMIPHSIESKAKGMPQTQTIAIDKFEINPDVANDKFTMPAPKPAPEQPAKP